MLTWIATYLFPNRRRKAAIDEAIAAAIEDARESGSLTVPEHIETLERTTRARLLVLVRQTPNEIEVAPEVLRSQIAALQDEVTELHLVAERAEALGLLASWLMRWAVGRRVRRAVREVAALRAKIRRHDRTKNQLEQWLDARVYLVAGEFRRAKRRADYAATFGDVVSAPHEIAVPAGRPLVLAGAN